MDGSVKPGGSVIAVGVGDGVAVIVGVEVGVGIGDGVSASAEVVDVTSKTAKNAEIIPASRRLSSLVGFWRLGWNTAQA